MELPLRVNSFRKMQLASDAMASERLVRAPYMLAQLLTAVPFRKKGILYFSFD